jgi:hypothetical protein
MNIDGDSTGGCKSADVAPIAPATDVSIAPLGGHMMSRLTRSGALLLFAFVIVAWGLNWTVTKLIVTQVSPLWTAAIRTAIGTLALLAMLAASRQFRIPKRGDIPVVLAISLFHMVAFAALMTAASSMSPSAARSSSAIRHHYGWRRGHGCCLRNIYRRGNWSGW